jgi:hypothetical protein
VEQRLQIHERRVLTARDEVLVVHVDAIQHVQQREIGALSQVEALRLGVVAAVAPIDMLDPAVITAVEHPQQRQRRHDGLPVVAELQQTLEMDVDGQRAWLVDNLDRRVRVSRREAEPPDAAATPVQVGDAAVQLHQPRRQLHGKQPAHQIR